LILETVAARRLSANYSIPVETWWSSSQVLHQTEPSLWLLSHLLHTFRQLDHQHSASNAFALLDDSLCYVDDHIPTLDAFGPARLDLIDYSATFRYELDLIQTWAVELAAVAAGADLAYLGLQLVRCAASQPADTPTCSSLCRLVRCSSYVDQLPSSSPISSQLSLLLYYLHSCAI
jgi:hypothetical protein